MKLVSKVLFKCDYFLAVVGGCDVFIFLLSGVIEFLAALADREPPLLLFETGVRCSLLLMECVVA